MMTQLVLLTLLQAADPAAQPASEIRSVELTDNTPAVFALTGTQRAGCRGSGVVCVAPGGSATMIGTELTRTGAALTVLARGTQIAAEGGLGQSTSDQPWQVELVAKFKQSSNETPVMLAIFDTADPESIARKESKVLWTVNMNPARELGMRFLLQPEDGFEPSHTYLARVVQATANADRILAEGVFHLE